MTGRVAHIWRHPIKSHGREALTEVRLTEGETLPWDRTWAVAHEASRATAGAWAPCANFSRGAKAPQLQAIQAVLDEATGRITLAHPDRPQLTFSPDTEGSAFLDWVAPLMPADRAASARIVRAGTRGMTDTPYPSISLCNLASNRAVSQKLGQDLSPQRWRGNIWLDGFDLWEELEWVGRTLRIGAAEMRVENPISRCLATAANPETGQRDADTLGALKSGWGHQNFGVYAVVTRTGAVRIGDPVTVL